MLKRFFLYVGLIGSVVLPVLPAYAQSSESISQSFFTNSTNISSGALVGIVPDQPNTVRLATTDSADKLVGAITTTPLVTLSEGENTVQVTITGRADVLVSDINGQIKAGDMITASPLEGVGMKATADGQVVGVAMTDMTVNQTEVRQINDTTGKEHQVQITRVPIQIGVSYYIAPTSGILPPFLQDLANAIAGKQVSVVRILVATVLILAGLISTSVLLYSAVRTAITSIGRNPLAAASIQKGIIQAGLSSLMIVAFVLAGAYLAITL